MYIGTTVERVTGNNDGVVKLLGFSVMRPSRLRVSLPRMHPSGREVMDSIADHKRDSSTKDMPQGELLMFVTGYQTIFVSVSVATESYREIVATKLCCYV